MENTKITIQNLLKTVTFLLITFCLIRYISSIFMMKNEEEISNSYYKTERGSNEVIFLGPSTMMNAVYPIELWSRYGIMSYNLGSGGQSIAMSYYLAKEAIARDHPRLIVLDCGRAFLNEKEGIKSFLHYLTDNMSFFSKTRIELIWDLVREGERWSFFFPLDTYHSRWKEGLTYSDFLKDEKCFTRGSKVEVNHWPADQYEQHEIDTEDAIGEGSREYLDRLVSLCRGTDTELLLVTIPFPGIRSDISQQEYDRRRNAAYALEKYADKNGILYLNELDRARDLGLDVTCDTRDGEHFSVTGSQKYTEHLGQYISNQFFPGEIRGPQDDFLTNAFDQYIEDKKIRKSQTCRLYFEYLIERVNTGHVIILISVKDTIGDEGIAIVQPFLTKLGLQTSLDKYGRNAYIAVVDDDKVLYEQVNPDEEGALSYNIQIEENLFSLVSSPFLQENKALIMINNRNFSLNNRGFNIVVWDKEQKKVIDSCSLDTFLSNVPITHMNN